MQCGLHLPPRLIIRRFELSDKTDSRSNFEQAMRGSVRSASGLVLVDDWGVDQFVYRYNSELSAKGKLDLIAALASLAASNMLHEVAISQRDSDSPHVLLRDRA